MWRLRLGQHLVRVDTQLDQLLLQLLLDLGSIEGLAEGDDLGIVPCGFPVDAFPLVSRRGHQPPLISRRLPGEHGATVRARLPRLEGQHQVSLLVCGHDLAQRDLHLIPPVELRSIKGHLVSGAVVLPALLVLPVGYQVEGDRPTQEIGQVVLGEHERILQQPAQEPLDTGDDGPNPHLPRLVEHVQGIARDHPSGIHAVHGIGEGAFL